VKPVEICWGAQTNETISAATISVASIHRVSFLLCWCLMVDRHVQSFKLVKDSEGTKRKLLIFCIALICALILTTFGISFICWIDDIKSHLKRALRA